MAAWAWRFGAEATTNNAAELSALYEAVKQLAELRYTPEKLGLGVLILGDSELIVGFCNRKYKPSKKFFNTITAVKAKTRQLQATVLFRHVYRQHNRLADWLANLAKHLPKSINLTSFLTTNHPSLTFLSTPPWPPSEAPMKLDRYGAQGVGG